MTNARKFAVGQIVDFDQQHMPWLKPAGPYEVTRVLPAEDAKSQTYRVKSKTELFERSAKEDEIVAVHSAAGKFAEAFGAVTDGGRGR